MRLIMSSTLVMRMLRPPIVLLLPSLLTVADVRLVKGQSTNSPPEVSIVWPAYHCLYAHTFRRLTCIKIKVSVKDVDGSIAQVQFFSDNILIGAVSNAPYEMTWESQGSPTLKAVAFDNLGASNESAAIQVNFPDFLNAPSVFEITSPPKGSVLSVPATFSFSAELLASRGCGTGLVEFFVGTNVVGVVTQSGPFTVATPPYSLTVTNIPEGDYQLSVRKDFLPTASYAPGSCDAFFVRVTKLGFQFPRLTLDGRFEFDVVTSFPTNQNIIEASSNLLNWVPISTNVPFTNTFTFTDPSPATNSPRFYRAVVPSQ